MTISAIIDCLRCPVDGQRLHEADGWLLTADGARRYPVEGGIAVLLAEKAQEKQANGHWQARA